MALADKPPEIPAPGETTEAPSTLDEMSFIDDNSGDRSAAIYFGNGSLGSAERAAKLGAGRGADPGAAAEEPNRQAFVA